MWNNILTVVMLLVLLLVLIGFHEAGHFAVAKMCNVYCAEFSLGFGPKLFSVKRKKGETAFSVRMLPLGGYVSMYSEEGELPDGVTVPKERSLEGVVWYKRMAIMSAGVIVNFLLSVIFCFAYALCFPDYSIVRAPGHEAEVTYSEGYHSLTYRLEEGTPVQSEFLIGVLSISDTDETPLFEQDVEFPFYGGLVLNSEQTKGGYVFDTDVTITLGESSADYVCMFSPSTLTSESDLVDSFTFYPKLSIAEAKEKKSDYIASFGSEWPNLLDLEEAELAEIGITGFPNLSVDAHKFVENETVAMHVPTIERSAYTRTSESGETSTSYVLDIATIEKKAVSFATELDLSGNVNLDPGTLKLDPETVWYSAGTRFENGSRLWCNLWVSIGQGLKALFTGNWSNLSGAIGIGVALGTVASTSGWAYSFFYLGALVSLNLAILNLFPFPGLDGWALLTCAYETITKRKIKERTKTIVSYIGLGLILALGIAILVMDVVKLVV